MNYSTLFFATVALSTLSTNDSLAMDFLEDFTKTMVPLVDIRSAMQPVNSLPKSNQVTIIDKGLLTIITAVISNTEISGEKKQRFIINTSRVTGTLLDIMGYADIRWNGSHDEALKKDFAVKLFCPRVLRFKGNTVEDLGTFQSFRHKELKEVIRSRPHQALYCAQKQGAFVYSLNEHFKLPFSKDTTFSFSSNPNMSLGEEANIEKYLEREIHKPIILLEKK